MKDDFPARARIAYFSMEIALRPEIHTYSGGLGILAGDTVRTCAELELPVVFVTLVSRDGYLAQRIEPPGRQVEAPDPWKPEEWAKPLGAKIVVEIEHREVWVRPWLYEHRSSFGYTTPVLLLDTDLEENQADDRKITAQLYGGDDAYRLRQEIVLGIGGIRVLRALGLEIETYHLNEGHSALLALELLRRTRVEAPDQPCFDLESVREQCVFTTHTPVEAGHDRFSYGLVEQLLDGYMDLAELKPLAGDSDLNMTRLALNLSAYVNGVAKRHAEISAQLFPGHRVHAITNGVHIGTWTSPSFTRIYSRHLPHWQSEPENLMHAERLDDNAVWEAHMESKAALLDRLASAGATGFGRDVLTIGFARRVTGYKRLDMLFSEPDRLAGLAARHPFQIVIAGKAHPHDQVGKDTIQLLHQRIGELAGRIPIAFLPNYDMALAQLMTAGADVWLNTPLPPLEASGTSGMKAALNGVLNLSVLDGWWMEAWIEGATGWSIGDASLGTAFDDADDLYTKLEKDVLPLYYGDRSRWIWMMKQAISKIGPIFNSHRMMRRYAAEAYLR